MTHFSSNLPLLRRRAGHTQESLAEALGVSRQAVTKWEGGTTLPEAATLLTLADLLGCTLDQLMRDKLSEADYPTPDTEAAAAEEARFALFVAYDRHMDRFAWMMAGGVALILAGVAALLALYATGLNSRLSAAALLLCVAAAVFLFIFGGISHSDFQKAHPVLPSFYTPQAVLDFRRIFRVGIACSVSAIVADTALLVIAAGIYRDRITIVILAIALFFLILAAAVGTIVLLGILRGKYDLEAYTQAAAMAADSDPASPRNRWHGVVMSLATAIFLLAGFLFHAWHPAWVVFPVGGLLCGVIDSIHQK